MFDTFWNFLRYRKHMKNLNTEDAEDRRWLMELNQNIRNMGFNDGVRAFDVYYRANKRVGQSIVQSELRKQEMIQKAALRDAKINRAMEEAAAKTAAIKAKEQARWDNYYASRSPYNPDWKPTIEKLNSRNPMTVREVHIGLIRKTYDIADHGQYAVSLVLNGKVMGVYSGKTSLEANSKATSDESNIARRYGLQRKDIKHIGNSSTFNAKVTVRREPSDDLDIDISHVNRAMGNNGPRSTDLDDLLDDIF